MSKEEIVRKTQGKKTYRPPSLSVYGRVSQLTSSGSVAGTEGNSTDSLREPATKPNYRA